MLMGGTCIVVLFKPVYASTLLLLLLLMMMLMTAKKLIEYVELSGYQRCSSKNDEE